MPVRCIRSLLFAIIIGSAVSAAYAAEEWTPLFDGKSLDNWVKRGGDAQYSIEGDAIVGRSGDPKRNTFLCTMRDYDNFVLEFDFRVDNKLNSGVQIRSASRPDGDRERVFGYQVEIDPSDRSYSAAIYDEARRGKFLADLKDNEPARNALKRGDWNQIRIEAVGDTFRTFINSVPAVSLVDNMTTSGFIGLQVHAIKTSSPLEVRWRNLRIREIEQPAPATAQQWGDWKGTTAEGVSVYAMVNALGGETFSAVMHDSPYVRQAPIATLNGKNQAGNIELAAGDVKAIVTGTTSFKGGNPAFEMKKIQRLSPSLGAAPPQGAVVLFDGASLDEWQKANGQPVAWKVVDGAMEVAPKSGSIQTRRGFQDVQLHLEFRTPFMPEKRGQDRGNSGVYLQGGYEIQILDSYGLEGRDNECGGIYKVGPPRINMCLPPTEWQTYDVTFRAPKFSADDQKTSSAQLTVLHNGVGIHAAAESAAPTPGGLVKEDPRTPMPIMLQDHGNLVQFRNVWALDLATTSTHVAPEVIVAEASKP